MSTYSAVAAAYRYADKESLLLRQAVQRQAVQTSEKNGERGSYDREREDGKIETWDSERT